MRRRVLLEDLALTIPFALALAAAALTMPANAAANDSAPATQGELVRHHGAKVQLAYVLPGTDWSKYKTIQLHVLDVPADVREAKSSSHKKFHESYLLGDKEVTALQDAYTDSMKKVFTDAGFTFVDTPQPDTLVIATRLMEIRLTAPIESSRLGYSGRSRTYTQGGGSMKIGAVLADAQSGRVIAQAADARSASSSLWQINNRVTNLADAKQIFREWARRLKDTIKP